MVWLVHSQMTRKGVIMSQRKKTNCLYGQDITEMVNGTPGLRQQRRNPLPHQDVVVSENTQGTG